MLAAQSGDKRAGMIKLIENIMRTSKKSSLYLCLAGAALSVLTLAARAQSPAVPAPQHRATTSAQPLKSDLDEHSLLLYNTHTGERLSIVYRRGDQYLPAALAKLDYFLRDHVNNDVRHFDPRLYDILSDLTASVGRPGGEIDIVCGYRSPTTNASLREHTTGVAKNSLHIQAEAIDLRMPGVDSLTLRRAALALHRGGVGYYPHSDFIHVDTGRVRQWCFSCSPALAAGE
jgi:uncharacterized protein YcbK (DUF882 family)